jgi:3',5'-cyclic AMP phosphodiesterase CpdA
MTTLTWLHLSDLHFRGAETSVDRARFESMLLDMKECCSAECLELDAVFFTGDVVFSGQKEQYDGVGKWLDEILDVCGMTGRRDKLFIVPGNHDVDRTTVEQPDWFYEHYKDFAKGLLNPDKPYEEIKVPR